MTSRYPARLWRYPVSGHRGKNLPLFFRRVCVPPRSPDIRKSYPPGHRPLNRLTFMLMCRQYQTEYRRIVKASAHCAAFMTIIRKKKGIYFMRVIIFWDIVPRKRSSLKIQRGWININKKLIRLSISAGDGGGIHIMFYRRRRVKACYRLDVCR